MFCIQFIEDSDGEESFLLWKKDAVGYDPISLDAKLMVVFKHLAFGAAMLPGQYYFQMRLTTLQRAMEELCHTISTNDTF